MAFMNENIQWIMKETKNITAYLLNMVLSRVKGA